MPFGDDISYGTAGASTPDFYTAFAQPLVKWANVQNRAYVHIEHPKYGGEVSGSWHTALTNAINDIEQSTQNTGTDSAQHGGTVLFGPHRYRFTAGVNIATKNNLRFVGTAGKDSISGGAGFGTSLYCATNGMTLFNLDNSAGSVNHWGPTFENLNFNAIWAPTGTKFIVISNVNHGLIRNCSFNAGSRQVENIGGGGAGGDTSYWRIEWSTFAAYSDIALIPPVGTITAVNFFNGTSGSWAIKTGSGYANALIKHVKVDSTANGVWVQGYKAVYEDLQLEATAIGLRIDKDTAVAFSGEHNVFREVHCTGRLGTETAIQITSNVSNFNRIDGFSHSGVGTILDDQSGGDWWGVGQWNDDGPPYLKLPRRYFGATPGTPANGAYIWVGTDGYVRFKGTDGVEKSAGSI